MGASVASTSYASQLIRVGILGCGVVGQGLLKLLRDRERVIRDSLGASIRVTRIAVREPGKPRGVDLGGVEVTKDALQVARAEDVDLLVEVMGGDAALAPVSAALRRGIPVVTANKGLLSLHGVELARAAAETGTTLRYEASAGGGIPVLQSLEHGLGTERFTLLVAILNGTTNYILSTMERDGRDFAEALEAARALGFAEADPSLDLSGADTAQRSWPGETHRIAVPHDSIPLGIIGMELEDLRQADPSLHRQAPGNPGSGSRRAGSQGSSGFHPQRYLLAAVRDGFSRIYLRGEATGSMLFYGKGAGALPTAQAVLGDVLASARELLDGRKSRGVLPEPEPALRLPLDEVRTKYYLRLIVEDRPGVLAQVAGCLGGARVSVAQMIQAEGIRGEASLTMLTHEARDRDVRDAVKAIAALPADSEAAARGRPDLRRMSAAAPWRGVVQGIPGDSSRDSRRGE
jgi:homoserine dehydrogenase